MLGKSWFIKFSMFGDFRYHCYVVKDLMVQYVHRLDNLYFLPQKYLNHQVLLW